MLQMAVFPSVSVEKRLYYVGVDGGVLGTGMVSGGDGFSD